eukprot:10106963-Alexandrium_andersonii.AAC.1
MATTVATFQEAGVRPSAQHRLKRARRGASPSRPHNQRQASEGRPSGPPTLPGLTRRKAALSSCVSNGSVRMSRWVRIGSRRMASGSP